MQPALSLHLPTLVVKNACFVPKDAIGNELLEARVIFDLVARAIAGVGRVQQSPQVGLGAVVKPLKIPNLAKQHGGDDEHMLGLLTAGGHAGNPSSSNELKVEIQGRRSRRWGNLTAMTD
jgi:hypothetical protein